VIAGSLETPGAFGVIFDRHGSTLLRFLARRVDPAEAEDLLGEVFRIAFERRSAFEQDRDSARPWLYGIAANVVAKHHRSEARRFRAMARVSARRLLDEDPAERAVAALTPAPGGPGSWTPSGHFPRPNARSSCSSPGRS
jgi:DNA-directed RNA polymerase specialized sigma subunit, sigma24 homolog